MACDLRAVDRVLKMIQARVRLFGLKGPDARAPEVVRVVINPAELAARGEAARRRDGDATEA